MKADEVHAVMARHLGEGERLLGRVSLAMCGRIGETTDGSRLGGAKTEPNAPPK
jgi:hypothetical protein